MKIFYYLSIAAFVCISGLTSKPVTAANSDSLAVINIWPGIAPGETTSDTGEITSPAGNPIVILTNVTEPQLLTFTPSGKAPKGGWPSVLVFPGGGYSVLSEAAEGSEIARWLNSLGYFAAVLHYRVPDNRIGAFQDAERAMSLVRSRASEFGVDPTKLGVIGFSAGGHLAARLSTGYDTRAYPAVDSIDSVSCRPNFTMLIYPAYLVDKTTNAVATELTPHAGMPPIFLVQTRLDPYFDILPYSQALLAAGISTETLAYAGGGHGYALHAASTEPVSNWPNEASAWLKTVLAAPATQY